MPLSNPGFDGEWDQLPEMLPKLNNMNQYESEKVFVTFLPPLDSMEVWKIRKIYQKKRLNGKITLFFFLTLPLSRFEAFFWKHMKYM